MKLNRKYIVIGVVIAIAAAMLMITLRKDEEVIPSKPLTASMSVDRSTLTPEGEITAEELGMLRQNKAKSVSAVKNKATIAIIYTNNTDIKLTNVKIRFRELPSNDPNNFILYGDTGISSYEKDANGNIIFSVYNVEPQESRTANIVVWAQRKGSSEYEAEVLSGDLAAKTDNVTIKVE